MKWKYAIASVGILAIVSLANIKVVEARTVYIDYNGYRWDVTTKAQDVSELLIREMGDYQNLVTDLPLETKLTENMTVIVMDKTTTDLNATVAANFKTATTPPPPPTPEPTPKPITIPPKPKPVVPVGSIYTGTATWYRHGDTLTTASRQFPIGTKLKVIAVSSGKSVEVIVNDYGPQASTGVALDLNAPAFSALAPLGAGRIQIKYYKI